MAYAELKTLKIAKRVMPWGAPEYRIEELDGFAITEWHGAASLPNLRERAAHIEGLRDGSIEPGNGGLESF